MSKDIDFEFGRSIGATHYRIVRDSGDASSFGVEWYKSDTKDDYWWNQAKRLWTGNAIYFSDSDEIPPADTWTIHNNDKPLCELSDEQYGKLHRAANAGGVVEFMDLGGEWCYSSHPSWDNDIAYRIKPKSERDTFIQQCVDLMTSETERFQDQMFAEVFDAIQRGDIKAPEVGK